MKNNMLNLEIVKIYKFTTFDYPKEEIVKVVNKTIHSDNCHSYFVTWKDDKSIHYYGQYIWDYGYANSNREFVFAEHAIKTCEEVVEENKVFDYEVVDSSKESVHTTIKGKGRIARLKENEAKATSKRSKKKINKDTINVKDKWLY